MNTTENDIQTEETETPKADSVSSKYYDDMPIELVEYLVKTDPRFAEKTVPQPAKFAEKTMPQPVKKEPKYTYPKDDTHMYKKSTPSIRKSKSYININKMSGKSVFILSSIVFVLLIMFVLIFNINSTNKKFNDAMTDLNNLKKLSTEFDKLSNDNKILKDKVSSLERILENGSVQASTQTSTTPNNASESPTVTTETTHTVAKGDNLSKISQKYYGSSNPSYYSKIMSANNLKNPNDLKIGMQLKIPPQ